MAQVAEFLVFAAALAGAVYVLGFTLWPQVPRIVALLRTGIDLEAASRQVTFIGEPRLRSRVTATFAQAAPRPAFRAAA